ncbi:MAG: cyclodeaminase/cyclohydrolase family protein [Candidatus Eremiobacteraeota bacterium]|nr:cyclodeaminase/cyclohydrolase family protein [Candidatus Eremiobacteraeota bacterium]
METLDEYFSKLASTSPTPGGGSAAMFVASSGAALLAMVCRITAQNAKTKEQKDACERIASQADVMRDTFVGARSLDETAFQSVVNAQKLPKATDDERAARTTSLQHALQRAAEVPLNAAGDAVTLLDLIEQAIEFSTPSLRSDLGCAAEFAGAALAACAYNVRINHKYMNDTAMIAQQSARLTELEQRAALLIQKIRLKLATAN